MRTIYKQSVPGKSIFYFGVAFLYLWIYLCVTRLHLQTENIEIILLFVLLFFLFSLFFFDYLCFFECLNYTQ